MHWQTLVRARTYTCPIRPLLLCARADRPCARPRSQNQFDSIDLSDNEIRKLECLAVLPRLKMLMLSNNRVIRIANGLGKAFPALETLVLSNNAIGTLRELENLASLRTLTMLSLVDNPVTKQPNYRALVISRLPKLKVLDFKKVKPIEREEAEAKFGKASMASQQQDEPGDEDPGAGAATEAKAGPTPEQINLIKDAIANASSLEEVSKLERALKAGNYAYITEHIAKREAAAAAGGAPVPGAQPTEAAAEPPAMDTSG